MVTLYPCFPVHPLSRARNSHTQLFNSFHKAIKISLLVILTMLLNSDADVHSLLEVLSMLRKIHLNIYVSIVIPHIRAQKSLLF